MEALTEEQTRTVIEALEYMSDVFMPDEAFRKIVDNGPYGDETYTMQGDDLAGFCWHFDQVLKAFGVTRDIMERFQSGS